MTRFCTFEGTPPSPSGFMKKLMHTFKAPDNQPLLDHIENGDIIGLNRLLSNQSLDINAPGRHTKEVNSQHTFWRTPLELAVDIGHPDIVVLLLERGAEITVPAMKLALNGALMDWNSPRTDQELKRAYSIIKALSAADADWPLSFASIQGVYKDHTYTPEDLIGKLGPEHAAKLGITPGMNPNPYTFTNPDDFAKAKTIQKVNAQVSTLDNATPAIANPSRPRRV